MNRLTLLALAIVTLPGTGCDRQGVHLVSDKSLPKGSVIRNTDELLTENLASSYTAQGQVLQGSGTYRETAVYETEILSPDKVRIMPIVDSVNQTITYLNESKADTSTGILQGIAIIGEKQGEEWIYKLESGTPTPEQSKILKEMTGRISSEEFFYPDHRVNIGDRWDMDPRAIQAWIGSDMLSSSGTGWMELREITTHGGHECARIFFNLQTESTFLDDDNQVVTVEVGLNGEIYRALDVFLDISVIANGQIKLTFDFIEEGTKSQIIMQGPVTHKGSAILR